VTTASCPNCRSPFEPRTIEGLYGRSLVIDVCRDCHGIWFDDGESLQLSPRGTLDLFRLIHEHPPGGRRPLSERLECPRCGLRLSLAVDQQRTTKFQYHRCARGHGRFITFFHFLRARNFVRSLTPREVADLRAHVKQVNCSNCGAPVHLDRDVACTYCRAPISMVDPDQMRATIADLQAADARRGQIDPGLPLTLMMERLKVEKVFAEAHAAGREPRLSFGPGEGTGLVEAGLGLVLQWLARDAGPPP
jgi:hypothetical protein